MVLFSTHEIERIAHVCHEANRAYAAATGEPAAQIHGPWLEAPEAIRESARVGVAHALEGASPEQLHTSWMRSKVADGWVYGAVRDNASKVHPCLVPYGELPAAQQAKDALFSAIVRALAAAIEAEHTHVTTTASSDVARSGPR